VNLHDRLGNHRETLVHSEQIIRDVDASDERALDRHDPIVDIADFGGIHDVVERAHWDRLGRPTPQLDDRLLTERASLTLKRHAHVGRDGPGRRLWLR